MMIRAAGGILLTLVLAGTSSVPSRAADEIKAGKWEFTTQMQLPGAAQSPPGVQASAGGNAPMTRTACIDAANPIPAEGQCKLDRVDRQGGVVTPESSVAVKTAVSRKSRETPETFVP